MPQLGDFVAAAALNRSRVLCGRSREALQAAEQLQADTATRLKLSEAEGSRLRGRLAVAEGKLKGLRLELAKLSSVQHQEQDKRAHTVSELVASVQVWHPLLHSPSCAASGRRPATLDPLVSEGRLHCM